jgi:parallel beta-helix repeat protein
MGLESILKESDIDHSIRINNDDDFESLGLPGDGSSDNPYRIEGKYFSFDANGIYIQNTTKYFVIKNCSFDSLLSGLSIHNIENHTATIENNIFLNNTFYAISISNANYSRIENNIMKYNKRGITVYSCYFPYIRNNTIFGGFVINDYKGNSGIIIRETYAAAIINNTINNFGYCMHVEKCCESLIENNTCLYAREDGSIYISMSSNIIVKRNIIYNSLCFYGIEISYSDNNTIIYNTIYQCALFGIVLSISNNNSIHHNNLLFNVILDQPQALDVGENNTWYETSTEEGNFWSDWSGSGPYEIEAAVPDYNYDFYPLSNIFGLNLSDLYFPNTTNDDSYEENDYGFNNPEIKLHNEKHSFKLYYADLDFFRIGLLANNRYSFFLEFNSTQINLDIYLFEEDPTFLEFNKLAGSYSSNNSEYFTFTSSVSDFFYLLVVGDLENYKNINQSYYNLTILTLPPISPSVSLKTKPYGFFLIVFVFVFCRKKKIK